jgi:Flp pilus assembly protein TadD
MIEQMKHIGFFFLLLMLAAACNTGPTDSSSKDQEANEKSSHQLDRSLLDRHPDSPLLIAPQHESESAFIERMKHIERKEPAYQKEDYEGLVDEGLTRYKINEYMEAVRYFTKAVEADPEQLDAYYYRGQVFIEMNNFPAAKSDFMRVTSMVDDDPETWNFLGFSQAQTGDDTAALESYNKAIAINPDNKMYYYNRGSSLAKMDKLEEALDDFDLAVQMGLETSGVFNNRANTRYLLGDFPGAISDFTRAIRFDSNSSAPYANRGFAYLFSGDTIRACADWHKADEMGHPLSKGFIQLYCKN